MSHGEMIEIELVDDSVAYGLREFCEHCAENAERVIEMVESGVLSPSGARPTEWRFTIHSVVRLQKARRLARDLEINLPGIALALELLEQVESLREQVRGMEHELALLRRSF